MLFTHAEKTAIIIALTKTMEMEDGRTEWRTILLMNLLHNWNVSIADMELMLSKGTEYCLTIEQMNEEKKIHLLLLLLELLTDSDGNCEQKAIPILAHVATIANVDKKVLMEAWRRHKLSKLYAKTLKKQNDFQ